MADTNDGEIVFRNTWFSLPADDPRLDAFVIDTDTLLGIGSLRQGVVFLICQQAACRAAGLDGSAPLLG